MKMLRSKEQQGDIQETELRFNRSQMASAVRAAYNEAQ
jgi:hypothetical protein